MAISDLNDAINQLVSDGVALPCTPTYSVASSAMVDADGNILFTAKNLYARKRMVVTTRMTAMTAAVDINLFL